MESYPPSTKAAAGGCKPPTGARGIDAILRRLRRVAGGKGYIIEIFLADERAAGAVRIVDAGTAGGGVESGEK